MLAEQEQVESLQARKRYRVAKFVTVRPERIRGQKHDHVNGVHRGRTSRWDITWIGNGWK